MLPPGQARDVGDDILLERSDGRKFINEFLMQFLERNGIFAGTPPKGRKVLLPPGQAGYVGDDTLLERSDGRKFIDEFLMQFLERNRFVESSHWAPPQVQMATVAATAARGVSTSSCLSVQMQ
jgi:hypothetical protein